MVATIFLGIFRVPFVKQPVLNGYSNIELSKMVVKIEMGKNDVTDRSIRRDRAQMECWSRAIGHLKADLGWSEMKCATVLSKMEIGPLNNILVSLGGPWGRILEELGGAK